MHAIKQGDTKAKFIFKHWYKEQCSIILGLAPPAKQFLKHQFHFIFLVRFPQLQARTDLFLPGSKDLIGLFIEHYLALQKGPHAKRWSFTITKKQNSKPASMTLKSHSPTFALQSFLLSSLLSKSFLQDLAYIKPLLC